MNRNIFLSAVAAALLFVCTAASAQQLAEPRDPLSSSCDGAWQQIRQSVDQLRTIDLASTREGREKLSCLLDTISQTTFSSRDSGLDILLAHQAVRLLIDAVGPQGYDFFAAQISSSTSRRVRPALINSLLSHGRPEAFAAYFSELRQDSQKKDAPKRSPEAALALFEPLILHGRCSADLCSRRISETLRAVSANLDVVTSQLRQLEAESPATSKSAERSRRLRAAIDRIVRNDAPIGNVPQ